MKNWHAQTIEDVFLHLFSSEDGVSKEEAENRIKRDGKNIIKSDKKINPFLIFLKQFKSGMVYVLFVAMTISLLFHKTIDFFVILFILFLNAILGFFQEYRAEKAVQALKKMVVPVARVYRDGKRIEVSAEEVVLGDVVFLSEGDKIPADIRLFYCKNFKTSESSLTGESTPVNKKAEQIEEFVDLGDRSNMAWMGTFVVAGRAKGIVVSIGDKTILGTIAKDIKEVEKRGGHFEEKVNFLAKQMALFAFFSFATILFLSLYLQKIKLKEVLDLSEEFRESLLFAVAALVSGIPEGLPAILIIVLAVGATRMSKRNAIIRKLSATETLGVVDHIITDKTGTLTQNTMNVRKIILATGEKIDVTGEGWSSEGEFFENKKKIIEIKNPVLKKLLEVVGVCNEAEVTKKEEGAYDVLGDPTEAALFVLAEKSKISREIMHEKQKKIDEIPFSSKLKYRASLSFSEDDSEKQIYFTGAPEEILEMATHKKIKEGKQRISKKEKDEILKGIEVLTKKAMRTIGVGYCVVDKDVKEIKKEYIKNIIFIGTVGIIDPPRKEVKEAILRAKKAGIRVIMATGDHKGTAVAIAQEVGLLENGEETAFSQKELLGLSNSKFEKVVSRVNVFARLTPHMKLKIAKTLQEQGAVIAMTGDGVNDAPAVKQADVGVAMGITGTDVTKEAGDIVLADDNFASIINAIEEGRIVFNNTRQASSFLITTNFAEFVTLITSILLRLPLPLLPTQILWLNLVTDGASGFPLAMEPKHDDVLQSPPRNKKENILSLETVPFLILMTVIMSTLSLFAFYFLYIEGGGSLEKARAGVFTVMAFTQLFNAFNMRSLKRSVFEIGFFTNKYIIATISVAVLLQVLVIENGFLGSIFGFDKLSVFEYILFIGLSSSVLILGEAYKYLRYK